MPLCGAARKLGRWRERVRVFFLCDVCLGSGQDTTRVDTPSEMQCEAEPGPGRSEVERSAVRGCDDDCVIRVQAMSIDFVVWDFHITHI